MCRDLIIQEDFEKISFDDDIQKSLYIEFDKKGTIPFIRRCNFNILYFGPHYNVFFDCMTIENRYYI